jgi:hypothetical protein
MRCEHDGALSLCNGQQCGMQHTTCKNGQATAKRQHATGDVRSAACDRRLATQHIQRDEMRRGTRRRTAHAMREGTLGRATENRQHATENVRHATEKGHADTIQRSAMPQTTTGKVCNGQLTTCNMHRENVTDDTQYATEKMHLTTHSVQQTISGQHAPCTG